MSKKLGEALRLGEEESVRVIEELELTQRQQMQTVRRLAGRAVETVITVWPAASPNRDRALARGTTRELRVTEIVATFDRPLEVAACVWLEAERSKVDLEPGYALCVGCTMLAPDEFEARFQPLQLTNLPPGVLGTEG